MESLLFSLDNRKELADDIISSSNGKHICADMILSVIKKYKFSDGEISLNYETSVRGKRVYLLSSPRTSDDIIYLNLAVNAAKLDGAKEIIPILPYHPYSRQDKKDYMRGPIGAKVFATTLETLGTTMVITFDLHADQIQAFYNIPIIHIEGKDVFDNYISNIFKENTILASPDASGVKRVKRMVDVLKYKKGIDVNYITIDKTRTKANEVDNMIIIGDVKEKDIIIIDDMVDTAGTLCKAANLLIEDGANSVNAVISHGVLSGLAFERISESKLSSLIISDSLDCDLSIIKNKIKTISVAEQIGLAIAAINNDMSYENLKLLAKD